jgi:hypothetical protein
MERRIDLSNIDLDECLAVIDERLSRWAEAGLTLKSLTWMDNDSPWPRPLLVNRADVASPMSLGVALDRRDGAEAEVVVYAGGWADFTTWVPGQDPVQAHHEIDDPAGFATCVDAALAVLVS